MLTIVVVAGLVFIIAALIPKINLLNYLPFFDEGPDQALKGTALLLSRSSGLAVLLLVLPKTKGRRKPGFILWNILIVFLMVATLFVIVGAMGSYLNYQLFPVYSASSFADAGVMERMDALFIAMWIKMCIRDRMILWCVGQRHAILYSCSRRPVRRKCTCELPPLRLSTLASTGWTPRPSRN